MKEKTCKTVRFYYGLILGAFTIVVGALFIWQVLSIYFTGKPSGVALEDYKPFSREIVLGALSKIDLFFWLWIAGVIAGFILWEVFPVKQRARKISPDLQYARLKKRMPSAAPEALKGEYSLNVGFKWVSFALNCAAWTLFAIACIWGIVYLSIPKNFPGEDMSAEVLEFVKNVFPCVFAGLIIICAVGIYEKFTVKKLLPSMQKITKGQKPQAPSGVHGVIHRADAALRNKWVILGVRIAVGILAVAFIIWGALNGNMLHIFGKAVAICSQCIGLG